MIAWDLSAPFAALLVVLVVSSAVALVRDRRRADAVETDRRLGAMSVRWQHEEQR